MSLVHIKGSSKRLREPRTLTVEEFKRLITHLKEPFRTMCIVAACLGLRVRELLGLQWGDFDWNELQVKIQRSWVAGIAGDVKTRYSEKWMPVNVDLAEVILAHQRRTDSEAGPTHWVFANPETENPYWPGRIQATGLYRRESRRALVASACTHFVTRTRRCCRPLRLM